MLCEVRLKRYTASCDVCEIVVAFMKYIIREKQICESKYNAGSKARYDIERILENSGVTVRDLVYEAPTGGNVLEKVLLHFRCYKEWNRCTDDIGAGDEVVIQLPIRNHTVFFKSVIRKMIKRGVKVTGVLHDLEALRGALIKDTGFQKKIRIGLEETSVLKILSKIVVHNSVMKEKLHFLYGIDTEKMSCIEIFDYNATEDSIGTEGGYKDIVVIAGNLSKKKAGYVYNLPCDVKFKLYGSGYEGGEDCDNVKYMGEFEPDELPDELEGGFGLVWDGPSTESCTGVYGEYMRINNPHKTSLYLASGIPVIVWKDAAIADFVQKNHCGIIVESLSDISGIIGTMPFEEYEHIRESAVMVGKKLRAGSYTKVALIR